MATWSGAVLPPASSIHIFLRFFFLLDLFSESGCPYAPWHIDRVRERSSLVWRGKNGCMDSPRRCMVCVCEYQSMDNLLLRSFLTEKTLLWIAHRELRLQTSKSMQCDHFWIVHYVTILPESNLNCTRIIPFANDTWNASFGFGVFECTLRIVTPNRLEYEVCLIVLIRLLQVLAFLNVPSNRSLTFGVDFEVFIGYDSHL